MRKEAAIELEEEDVVPRYCALDFNDIQEIVRRPAAKKAPPRGGLVSSIAAALGGAALLALMVVWIVLLDAVFNH